MSRTYLKISPAIASGIRLIMTDIDGTVTDIKGQVETVSKNAMSALAEQGIMVGFVSGRTLPRLEPLAFDIGIDGPIIGENGGIAKLKPHSELLDLGYSRAPALRDLNRLKKLFPNAIEPTEDDADRHVDVGFKVTGVDTAELSKHLQESELLDSGYMLHLSQCGISKGVTLQSILDRIDGGDLSPGQVMVFGDSLTDISLFRAFPNSVLVRNPRLSVSDKVMMGSTAEYVSELELGAGFAQVAEHILRLRR